MPALAPSQYTAAQKRVSTGGMDETAAQQLHVTIEDGGLSWGHGALGCGELHVHSPARIRPNRALDAGMPVTDLDDRLQRSLQAIHPDPVGRGNVTPVALLRFAGSHDDASMTGIDLQNVQSFPAADAETASLSYGEMVNAPVPAEDTSVAID